MFLFFWSLSNVFEVWEIMVLQIIITIITNMSSASNSSSSGSRWAKTKTETFLESNGQNLFRTVEKCWKKIKPLGHSGVSKKWKNATFWPFPPSWGIWPMCLNSNLIPFWPWRIMSSESASTRNLAPESVNHLNRCLCSHCSHCSQCLLVSTSVY